jgi:hypothetical protein
VISKRLRAYRLDRSGWGRPSGLRPRSHPSNCAGYHVGQPVSRHTHRAQCSPLIGGGVPVARASAIASSKASPMSMSHVIACRPSDRLSVMDWAKAWSNCSCNTGEQAYQRSGE